MSPNDFTQLAQTALALRRAVMAGTPQTRLRGKTIALLSDASEPDDVEIVRIARATVELGGRLDQVHPRLTASSSEPDVRKTAHMLGRLYDGVLCRNMAPRLVEQLGLAAGVPVCEISLSTSHPVAAVMVLLGGSGAEEEMREFALQALLLEAIG